MKQQASSNGHQPQASTAAPSQPLIVAQGIGKSYPGVPALAPLSLAVQPGERIALVGPSGSGKTTLLYLLAGIVQPSEGQVFIAGQPLAQLRPGRELARLVGIIHQQFDLVPHLPVLHNVLAGRLGEWSFSRSLFSLVWPQERHLAAQALTQLGIGDKLRERTAHLSGGEQQRVAIARLMVQSPRVILADEPVASLDPARAEDLMRLLAELAISSHKTLIASIHSPYLIQRHFSRVIALRRGHLEFDLPASQVTEAQLNALYDLKPTPSEAPAAVL